MTSKIHVQPDCGNAPRKLFLKELNIAFANADVTSVTDLIPEEITWEIVGTKKVNGVEKYLAELKRQKIWDTKELFIDTIITHGREASVSGHLVSADDKKVSFCDIYKFKGAGGTTINSITSFIIAHKATRIYTPLQSRSPATWKMNEVGMA